MLLALVLGCAEGPVAVDPALTPAERLDALAPGLAKETARYTDDLGAVADTLERASPRLRRFLLPKDAGSLPDAVEELPDGPDIAWSKVSRKREGATWRYTGHVEGTDLDRLQLFVDNVGGPAPDLRIDLPFDHATQLLASTVVPGGTTVEDPVAIAGQAWRDDHGWDFTFTLDPRLEGRAEHPVAMMARALGPLADASDDGRAVPERDRVDDAPAGLFGSGSHTVELVVELLPVGASDPDLLVAVAATWGPWLDLVQPSVRATVHADARDRLNYAFELDKWLAAPPPDEAGQRAARTWSVHALGPVQKLLWAWPGGEGAVYGVRPLGWESGRLSAEAYRFHVADVATLRTLRDELPLGDDPMATADARDTLVWADLDYRADDAGMQALCDQKQLDRRTCFQWQQDREQGRSLGSVDGVPVPLHKGTSASYQTDRWIADGSFSGDCASATSVMISAAQAVGLAPLALGWAGATWSDPTHNLPLIWDGSAFRATQAGPSGKWNGHDAFVYATVPVVNPASLMLGWGGYGAAGGAVPSAQTTYGELNDWLDAGIAPDTVLRWLADAHEGGWPQIR